MFTIPLLTNEWRNAMRNVLLISLAAIIFIAKVGDLGYISFAADL